MKDLVLSDVHLEVTGASRGLAHVRYSEKSMGRGIIYLGRMIKLHLAMYLPVGNQVWLSWKAFKG